MNSKMTPAEQGPANTSAGIRAPQTSGTAAPIRSRELFGAGRQLLIEHSGHVYLLRITQNNKLILTK